MIIAHQIDPNSIKNRSITTIRKNYKIRQRKMSRFAGRQPNWDGAEIYGLIAKKLELLMDYAQTDSVTSMDEWRIEWIKRAITLGKHLYNRYTYPSHININNSNRFIEVRDLPLKEKQNKYLNQDFYDVKAKHLLFNILINYIDVWWD